MGVDTRTRQIVQKNSKWWTHLSNIFCKHLCECLCLQESLCGVAYPWMYARVHAMNLCKTILSSLLLFIKGSVNRSGNKSNSVCLRWRVSAAKEHTANRAAGLPHKAVSVFGYIGLDYQGMDLGNTEEQIRGLGKRKISDRVGLVLFKYRTHQVNWFWGFFSSAQGVRFFVL